MTEKNQIYNAFIEAGLKSEANLLSTTENGERIVGLGHYIAILDDLEGVNYNIGPVLAPFYYKKSSLHIKAMVEVTDFIVSSFREGKLEKISGLNSIRTDILKKFLETYSK